MILTELKAYAEQRMQLPPAMYGEAKVGWYINLNSKGVFESWTCLKDPTIKALKRGKPMTVPHVARTVGIKPKLLVDTGEYVLGLARPTSKPERVADCHAQFKALVQACAEATGEESVEAISQFLNSDQLEQAKALCPEGFDPSEVVTFRVGTLIPANADENLAGVEQFWAAQTSGSEAQDNQSKVASMTCLVTGKEGPVEQRLPFLIKGLIGGQPSGTALVSANSSAFMSYGLKNSLSSPISREAAECFAKALNGLLASEQSRIYVGGAAYVFWTKEPTTFNPFSYLNKPDPLAVKNLLQSPLTAQPASGLKTNQFYALALSANNARAVIRDWLETTVAHVEANLRTWFAAQTLVDAYGEAGRPLSVYALAASLYRDPSKEMLPAVPTRLVRSALQGDRLPDDLLVRLIRRNRAERDVTYPRAVLTKLIFSTDPSRNLMMTAMEQLNLNPSLEGNNRAAYY